MVGFDESSSDRLTDSEYALAGAFAGGLTRAISQPLDVVKIRFQLQVEPLKKSPNVKYWGVSQALRRIVHEEGVLALWKGHVPAQALSIIFGVAQATCFEVLTRKIWYLLPDWHGSQYKPAIHFVCGGVAGMFASVASFPFDVVRTRLVAQGKPKMYANASHAMSEILKKEGLKGLFRGLTPVLVQMAPHSGVQFSTYTLLIKILSSREDMSTKVEHSLAVGAVAGAVAKTVVYPLDLAKKRMQVIGFEEGRRQFGQTFSTSGLLHCIQKIKRTEGVSALFKGLWPSTIKAAVVSALFFTFYENSCAMILKYK